MDRDNIIKSVSYSYVILGIYYCFDMASMNKQTIASLSVAGFLFVLAEYFQVYSAKYDSHSKVFRLFQSLITALGTLAIILMLVFPFVNIERFSENIYEAVGTVTLLIGLGITIYVIAKKHEIKDKEYYEKVFQLIVESEKISDEARAINSEAKMFRDTYNKETKSIEKD